MTGAVLDRPRSLLSTCPREAEAPSGGRVTLEERLGSALAELQQSGHSECPICHERMVVSRAGARETGACGSCGTRLT